MSSLIPRVLFVFSVAFALNACDRSRSAEAPPPPSEATRAAEAPESPKSPRGAGIPFEAGSDPQIEELEDVDLAAFVAGEPWCTKGRGGERVHFAPGGDFARQGGTGESETRGTWRAEGQILSVVTPGAAARPLDAQAASVNGRPVLLLEGRLFGRCDE